MRVTRLVLSFLLILSSSPRLDAQQSTTTPQRDPQAVDILNQCLNLAGGISTIGAIVDYTASGVITYHWAGKDVDGNVTVRGRGLDQFRMDASLPTGVRSWAASRGVSSQQAEDGSVSQRRGFAALNPSSFAFPYMQLAAATKSSNFQLLNRGIVQLYGQSAYDIRVLGFSLQGSPSQDPKTELDATDFFIDTSTLQVVMLREMPLPSANSPPGPLHQIRFSDYRTVNGVLVPFTIAEAVGGQETWIIHLDRISFNSGLVQSDFEF
jgi:hypothetical protein